MADLVVTVPQRIWEDWIAEGDAAGERHRGDLWSYTVGGAKPDIRPGERVYVVACGALRGYAPLVYVERDGGRWALIRGGGAVAVTIPEPIKGFRGWRRRWWDRADEVPFPEWKQRGAHKARFSRAQPDGDALTLFGAPSRVAPRARALTPTPSPSAPAAPPPGPTPEQRPERHPIPLDEALAQARALGWPEPLLTGKEDGPRPVPDYVGARGLQYSLQAMQEQAERRGDRFDILAVNEDFIGFGHRVGGETSFTRFRRWPYTTTPPWKRTAAAQAEEAS